MSMLSKALGGGGGSIPGYDTAKLNNIINQGYTKRKNLLEGAFGQLPQFGQDYEKKATTNEQNFSNANLGATEEYQKNLASLGDEEKAANELAVANNREQNFRQVPEVERRIRDIVGATIGFGSGAAAPQLAAPTINAAQASGDFANNLEVNRLNNNAARRATGVNAVFSTKQQNALNKLGIDQETAQMLMDTGRSDVLNKALQLSGLEGENAQSLLDIEQLKQSQDIAQAQANAKARSGRLGAITSLIGTGAGAFFGPTGALIGNQIGNTVGGGNGGGNDALLAAILARQKQPAVKAS